MRIKVSFYLTDAYIEVPDGLEPDSEEESKVIHKAVSRMDLNALAHDYDYEVCNEEDD